MRRSVYLALGSNLGDRESNIRAALERLDSVFGVHYEKISPFLETSAIGFDGPDFINCIAVYKSEADPFTILGWCKGIERELGRDDTPEYGPDGARIYHDRLIDIDILRVGRLKIQTPMLTIPHPQVYNRPYIEELLLNLRN